MENQNLKSILNVDRLQRLMDNFTAATGTGTAILDLEANILVASGWQKICTEFHRKNPQTNKKCLESDVEIANALEVGQEYKIYKCLNGLVDVAVPILVDGNRVANLFIGQFLTQKADTDFFKKQAATYNFDEKEYLEALSQVPVFTEEEVKRKLNFLRELSELIGEMGFTKLNLQDISENLEQKVVDRTNQLKDSQMATLNMMQDVEQARRDMENQKDILESVLDSVPGIFYQISTEAKFVRWNNYFTNITGYNDEEMKKISPLDLFKGDDKNKISESIKKVFKEGFADVEANLLGKDGNTIPHLFTGTLKQIDGEPFLIGVGLDITKIKQAEEALRETSNRLVEAQKVAHLGNWEWDAVNDEITGSEEFYRLFDLADDKQSLLRYQHFIARLHPDDLERVNSDVEESMKQKKPYNTEYRVKLKNGDWRYIHAKGQVFTDAKGNPIRLIGTCLDITVRKQAEEEIKKSEEKYRDVVENTDDLITVVDGEGNLTFTNPVCQRIWGKSAEKMIGKSTFEMIHPDDRELTQQEFGKWISRKSDTIAFENRQVNQVTGEIFVMQWIVKPKYNEDGSIAKITSLARDITERKQAEKKIEAYNQQLKANQKKLLESNAELEQFAYVASHDLKEPLRMVSSYTQLLERRYKDKLDDKAQKYIAYAVDGANRMQTLIDDLLQFSRIATQGKEFEKADANTILENVQSDLENLINETKAVITNDKLPEIYADKIQLERVFQNLISNAIKFRKKDQDPRIHISARKDKNNWLFSVKDNGIGIHKDFNEKVFIIFQRLHSKDEYEGTGIGLAVSKKIIARHGGKLWFESELGNLPADMSAEQAGKAGGTTFYFTLPIKNIKYE